MFQYLSCIKKHIEPSQDGQSIFGPALTVPFLFFLCISKYLVHVHVLPSLNRSLIFTPHTVE